MVVGAVATSLIAFSSVRDGTDVSVMHPDGGGMRLVSHTAMYGFGAEFSPDGSRIATHGAIMNTDGSGAVVPIAGGFGPTWSPDGHRIAYLRYSDAAYRGTDLFVANADGSGERRLTNAASRQTTASWSPDGSRIALSRGPTSGMLPRDFNIFTVNADGSGEAQLTHVPDRGGNRGAYGPDWSPDGRQIAFSTDEADPSTVEIAVMNADGTGQRVLTVGDEYGFAPQWSPDGTRIAFVGGRSAAGPSELAVVNADGTGLRWLGGTSLLSGLVWSPDGTQIAYSTYRDGDGEVHVIDAGGGEPLQLTYNTVDDYVWDWTTVAPVAPAPPARHLRAVLVRRAAKLRRGRIALVLRCPAAATVECAGTVALRRGRLRLGSKAFRIAPGRTATVKVRLSRRARRTIRRVKPTRVAVVVRTTGLPARTTRVRVR